MKEKYLIEGIRKFLKTLPDCEFEKRHGGSYGKSGQPDITGCLRGLRFEIEAKVPGNVPTDLQINQLEKWSKAGAWCLVAYNVDDVRMMMRQMYAALRSYDYHSFDRGRYVFEKGTEVYESYKAG